MECQQSTSDIETTAYDDTELVSSTTKLVNRGQDTMVLEFWIYKIYVDIFVIVNYYTYILHIVASGASALPMGFSVQYLANSAIRVNNAPP